MLFYLKNESGSKINVEIPGYGHCTFSPGDVKAFEAANETKMEARATPGKEAGLTFYPESAFKQEVAPAATDDNPPDGSPAEVTVGGSADVVTETTTDAPSADAVDVGSTDDTQEVTNGDETPGTA